jgi:hypothetical protein
MAIVCLNENIMVLELSEVTCDLDLSLEGSEIIQGDSFVDNVMIYIAGFIMRMLIKKEKCYTVLLYFFERKQRQDHLSFN